MDDRIMAINRRTSTPRLSPTDVAGPAGAPAVETWERLAVRQAKPARFDPAVLAGLPEPARRWLTHTIAPGTHLARAVMLEMEGHIRIGRWMPFRAVQLHAPPDGYVWAARAKLGPLAISGFDRYDNNTGEMRWRLLGHTPVVTAAGPDFDRSAAGASPSTPCSCLPPLSTRRSPGATEPTLTRPPPSGPSATTH